MHEFQADFKITYHYLLRAKFWSWSRRKAYLLLLLGALLQVAGFQLIRGVIEPFELMRSLAWVYAGFLILSFAVMGISTLAQMKYKRLLAFEQAHFIFSRSGIRFRTNRDSAKKKYPGVKSVEFENQGKCSESVLSSEKNRHGSSSIKKNWVRLPIKRN